MILQKQLFRITTVIDEAFCLHIITNNYNLNYENCLCWYHAQSISPETILVSGFNMSQQLIRQFFKNLPVNCSMIDKKML